MSVIVPPCDKYMELNDLSPLKESIKRLLDEAENIKKAEVISSDGTALISRVTGPKTNKWVADLKIINARYLNSHQLYQEINNKLFHFNHRLSVFNELIGL